MGGKDAFTDIWVTAEEGTSQAALRDAVAGPCRPASKPSGDQAADEAASDVNEAVSFIGTFLLVFAGVALVVGSFLIVNTFSILVAQRSRELALFRALGANRRQVTRSVVLEAVAIGLVGSTVGLGLGFVWRWASRRCSRPSVSTCRDSRWSSSRPQPLPRMPWGCW